MHLPPDRSAPSELHESLLDQAALEGITEDIPRDDELHAYGRFWRRLGAVAVDMSLILGSIFFVAFLMAALMVTVSALGGPSPVAGWLAVVSIFAAVMLYEPVLVSRTGGTVGHHVLNLKVVPDEPGETTLPFRWAFIRSMVKGFVGLPSFVLMAITGRNQAFHDLLTGSTVQIKNLERAKRHHYTLDRPAHEVTDVSRGRRIGVTLAYLAGFTTLNWILDLLLPETGLLVNGAYGLLSLAGGGLIVYMGWDGRLPGARSQER